MYPYPGFHHWHRFHRGPSRLVWFTFGALTTAWFMKRKEWCNESAYANCVRTRIREFNPQPQGDASQAPQPPPSPWSPKTISETINNIPPAFSQQQQQPQQAEQRPTPANPWGWHANPWGFTPEQEKNFQEERERMAQMARQASEAMADMSEATIDSVLASVENLKTKLAEARARREQERKEYEAKLEEQRRNPPRLV